MKFTVCLRWLVLLGAIGSTTSMIVVSVSASLKMEAISSLKYFSAILSAVSPALFRALTLIPGNDSTVLTI